MKNVFLALLLLLLLPLNGFALAQLDLNSASVDQIQALPGVGKKTAEAIVAARPFKSVEDLKNVKGIGEAKFARLQSLVTAGSAAAATAASPGSPSGVAPTMPTNVAAPSKAIASHTANAALKAGEMVNVNTASLEELDRLPGVGPAKAKAIVAGRPFASVDDLTKVKGIKQATLEKIRPFVTVK